MLRPQDVTLSVVMPVYNERATLAEAVERVRAVSLRVELICVDDASTDGSGALLQSLHDEGRIHRLVRHEVNQGKGRAVRSGIDAATGDVIVIQDADLEYDPRDLHAVIDPILQGKAGRDGAFGSWVSQTGDNNDSFIEQGLTDTDNSNDNDLAVVTQTGSGNYSLIGQTGDSHIANVLQAGSDNDSFITQSNLNNEATVNQYSDGNTSNVTQGGTNNVATVTQN